MTRETRRRLDERIEREIELLDTLVPGTAGYSEATQRLDTLIKARYDTVDGGVARWLKLGVEAAGVVCPLIFYGVWMKRGLQFEQTGAFTSNVFKGLMSKFRPAK